MLIPSPRLTKQDRQTWATYQARDVAHALSAGYRARKEQAQAAIRNFFKDKQDGYVGVSWGKDSVVIAHLAHGLDLPVVWVKVRPIANPDCCLVRDQYLARFPCKYEEIPVECTRDDEGWHASGTLERGFAQAAAKFGDRHVSGIRGEESATRKLRTWRFGTSTDRTCAPIAYWSGADVFAYLAEHDLPIHPAYAMSHRGLAPRDRLRVASLGGKRGTGMGRSGWEETYYGNALMALERARTVDEAESLIQAWTCV